MRSRKGENRYSDLRAFENEIAPDVLVFARQCSHRTAITQNPAQSTRSGDAWMPASPLDSHRIFMRDLADIATRLWLGSGLIVRRGDKRLGAAADRLRRSELRISQRSHHFEHFAARGEHAAAFALVLVQRVHKFHHLLGLVALSRSGVDLPPATQFLTPLELRRADRLFSHFLPVVLPTVLATTIDCHFLIANGPG